MEEKQIYLVQFNDCGEIYIAATSYSEVEKIFLSKYGDNTPSFRIKSIEKKGKFLESKS